MDAGQEKRLGIGLDRRTFLGGAVAGALPFISSAAADEPRVRSRAEKAARYPGVILRQHNPDNLEFPFAALEDFLTANEQFYVRTHFHVPNLDAKSWRLKIEGAVSKPLELDYDELRKIPSHKITSVLECSGNNRIFLKPQQNGLRWELGGVSNAEWTGVRLADVLERAGIENDAVEVIAEGADKGEIKPASPGVISFARSLPLKKARRPEVMLAYKMNGKDLPPAHGAPVRLLVAGWYGMASVKWLQRLIVTKQPFHGFFQTFMYSLWDRSQGVPHLVPASNIQVKAEIARPMRGEVVPGEAAYRIFGAAWAGESSVAKVEVSSDSGKSWHEAKLLDKAEPFTWRRWEHGWQTPAETGPCVLMARATDAQGQTQPMKRDEDRRDGVITHVLPIEVEIGRK